MGQPDRYGGAGHGRQRRRPGRPAGFLARGGPRPGEGGDRGGLRARAGRPPCRSGRPGDVAGHRASPPRSPRRPARTGFVVPVSRVVSMWQAEVRIDLDAIRDNVATLCAATTAEVMAVVKADGYGHGMLPAARAALAGGATWLGGATLDEALTLRRARHPPPGTDPLPP